MKKKRIYSQKPVEAVHLSTERISKFMISISNLTSNKSGKPYIFSDLNLDFKEKQVSGNRRSSDIASGNDLVVDYDGEAIKNSIRNILSQKRYLVDLNVNLKQYIGDTISKPRGEMLGEDIRIALSTYEPRVRVDKIFVNANIDQSTYFITIILTMLNLNQLLRIDSAFDKSGNFSILNN